MSTCSPRATPSLTRVKDRHSHWPTPRAQQQTSICADDAHHGLSGYPRVSSANTAHMPHESRHQQADTNLRLISCTATSRPHTETSTSLDAPLAWPSTYGVFKVPHTARASASRTECEPRTLSYLSLLHATATARFRQEIANLSAYSLRQRKGRTTLLTRPIIAIEIPRRESGVSRDLSNALLSKNYNKKRNKPHLYRSGRGRGRGRGWMRAQGDPCGQAARKSADISYKLPRAVRMQRTSMPHRLPSEGLE